MEKKVYDFPFDQVQTQVTQAFRKIGGKATVADLITQTGLAKYQVEKVVPAIVDDCAGQMQVTESGEILYYFPRGMSSRTKGWKAFWKQAGQITAKVLAFLFKIWIMVMLVGYFALFLLIFLVAVVAAIALSFAKKDDRDSDSGIGFYLVAKLFEWFILLWLYSGDSDMRQTRERKKPFYKAVFSFVFGVEGFKAEWEQAEKKALIFLIQRQNGLISLEEVMALTGRDRSAANQLVSRFLLEFEGEPQVSDRGTLYYAFPELMKVTRPREAVDLPAQPLIPFSGNKGSTNAWISFFNGFNALFGAYYLYFGLTGWEHTGWGLLYGFVAVLADALGFPQAEPVITIVLGVVPLAYSLFFFGVPLVRFFREKSQNLLIKTANFRRRLVNFVLGRPQSIDLDQIQPADQTELPVKVAELPKLRESLLRELADARSVEVTAKGAGGFTFSVPELGAEAEDLAAVRKKNGPAFQLGKTVFDSGQ